MNSNKADSINRDLKERPVTQALKATKWPPYKLGTSKDAL